MADEPNRHFLLSEGVNKGSVKDLIIGIEKVNRYDSEQEEEKAKYERKPITFIINSPGGSVYDGFALLSAMQVSKTPVHTYCYGWAMSMGFILFTAGSKRFMTPWGTLMYHQISSGNSGKIQEQVEDLEESKRLETVYDDYVLAHTNILKSQLDEVKKGKGDWHIDVHEAKKLGIVDEIIEGKRVKDDN